MDMMCLVVGVHVKQVDMKEERKEENAVKVN